jgi:hypothetical protein
MSMEGAPQNNKQEKQLQTTAITPEILGKKEKTPLDKVVATSDFEVSSFINDSALDMLKNELDTNGVKYSIIGKGVSPMYTTSKIELRGSRKDVEKMLEYMRNFDFGSETVKNYKKDLGIS